MVFSRSRAVQRRSHGDTQQSGRRYPTTTKSAALWHSLRTPDVRTRLGASMSLPFHPRPGPVVVPSGAEPSGAEPRVARKSARSAAPLPSAARLRLLLGFSLSASPWRSAVSPTSLRAAVPDPAPRRRGPSGLGELRALPSWSPAPQPPPRAAAASAPVRQPSPRARSSRAASPRHLHAGS